MITLLDFAEIYQNKVSTAIIRALAKNVLTLKHGINHLEGLVDLLTDLSAGQDDLAAHENEQHDLGLDHAVNETREQLGFVRTKVMMAGSQTLETNGEFDVARSDNVLDLEVGELGVKPKFLDDTGVLSGSKLRVVLRLGTSDNHLARSEDQSGGLGLADTHDNSGETLRVILSVTGMQSNRLQVKTAVKIDGSDDVPLGVLNLIANLNVTQKGTYCKVGVMPLAPWVAAGVAAGVARVTPFPLVA